MVVIFALLVFMWVSIGREPGPGPADVAIAYEHAWDHLDFDLLFDLSGDELRDGMRRDRFVAAKRHAYENANARARLGAEVRLAGPPEFMPDGIPQLTIDQAVDRVYCYYSFGENFWSRMPVAPQSFDYPSNGVLDLTAEFRSLAIPPTGGSLELDCWGWNGGLKVIGSG
jgi:hypothetical protein